MQAPAKKPETASSQHTNPKSDIEISQAAKKRPIIDIVEESPFKPLDTLQIAHRLQDMRVLERIRRGTSARANSAPSGLRRGQM